MKVSKIEIDSREALNRLAQPVFFGPEERQNAFDIIMRTGTPAQKESAAKARQKWPIDGTKVAVTV
jgi:hypothetical protein